jgi:hypothetical protein
MLSTQQPQMKSLRNQSLHMHPTLLPIIHPFNWLHASLHRQSVEIAKL